MRSVTAQILDGKAALAYSRMRKLDPRGAFGREDRHQQRLLQAAAGVALAAPRTGQKLSLEQVQRVQVGVAHADGFARLGGVGEQLRLPCKPQHHSHRLRQ